jgi:hypothetical protein
MAISGHGGGRAAKLRRGIEGGSTVGWFAQESRWAVGRRGAAAHTGRWRLSAKVGKEERVSP